MFVSFKSLADVGQPHLSLSFRFKNVSLIHFPSHSLRMTNTGPGERRIIWQPSVLATQGGWRRTRSRCAPPSWSGRTLRCGSKWPSCGRTAVAARTPWPDMRLSTARCKDLRIKSKKCQWDKSKTSFPAEFNTDTNTKGIKICTLVFADLQSLCQAPAPPDAGVLDTHWQAARHSGSGGHRKSVESAWLLHSEKKGTILPWSNTHGKHGLSKDDFKKTRKYEESRVVQKNHRLLNKTQISFF